MLERRTSEKNLGKLVSKWMGFACLMVGVGYGVKNMSSVHNTVQLIYEVKAPSMRVLIKDADGELVRTAEFSRAPFEHEAVLPEGRYTAFIELPEKVLNPARFQVEGDGTIVVRPPIPGSGRDTPAGLPTE